MALRSKQALVAMWIVFSAVFTFAGAASGNAAAWTLDAAENVTSLSVSADGGRIAVGSYGAKAYSFGADGTPQFAFEARNVVTGVAFLGDGSLLVSSDDRRLYKLDEAGRPVWEKDAKRQVKSVAASRDGATSAYIAQGQPAVFFIDPATGETVRESDIGIAPAQLSVSPAGRYVAAGAADQYAYVMDAEGLLLRRMGVTGSIEAVSVTDDGTVAVGTSRNEIVIFSPDGAASAAMTAKDVVTDVALSEDGAFVAAADYSGNVYLFSRDGRTLWSSRIDGAGRQVAFNREATALYLGSGAGTVHAYDVAGAVASAKSGAAVRTAAIVFAAAAAAALLGGGLLALKRKRKLSVFVEAWRARYVYAALLPSFALIFVFLYYPAFSGLFHSLYDWNPGGRTVFVGLANFERMANDPYVTKGLGNLALLIVTGLVKTLVPPLIAAELIYHLRNKRAQYGYRTLFVASMVVPAVAGLLIWQNLYDPNVGLINKALEAFGLPGHAWLGDPNSALWAVIFIGFPFIGILQLLVFYAGLLAIPEELIESAKMDGAGLWRVIRSIHLPLLSGQFKLLLILCLIGVIQDFGAILIVTGGGPMDSTYVPALQMYYAATVFNDLGYASALGVAMFAVILAITIVNMRLIKTAHE
ncbi:ABC transporter permease subunit [Paenibacillus sp.]|uniref:ABC transporter permease subunit n=1 Tax=Paenibacillus sp. TaxID=58172 RepID=UPI002D74866B|nr:ABC transporter permease subunit [Paenibacillus sp.]HZG88177.1 ABC transporter permease subunit [Paenibacillus sp.]